MSIWETLEPKKVFFYFEELSNIPHGSGNTKAISDYCVSFAQKRNLTYFQDSWNNVVIQKKGTPGYETSAPVILQGHLDMVCEKEAGMEIDFQKEGLQLYQDGDFLKAKGTTLGGDDGIAIAYALALLDEDTIAHPPLEAIFTVDEEIGMVGASAIDLSMIKGKWLLNIDSDEEGVFLTGCAGGIKADCSLPIERESVWGKQYEIRFRGGMGGHSGMEIQKERANIIVETSRFLQKLQGRISFWLEEFSSGVMDNAIPRESDLRILVPKEQEDSLFAFVKEWTSLLQKEYQACDGNIFVEVFPKQTGTFSVLTKETFQRVLLFLRNIPYGVQHMSVEIPNLVETSLNPGILKINQEGFSLSFSIRSSVESRKWEVADRLQILTEGLGGTFSVSGNYPGWEYRPESPLRDLMCQTYLDLFGKEPVIQGVHAGLECGILTGKIKDLDCISFGPWNFDIHTPKERLSISSTERVWKLIVEFLKRAK